MADTIEDLKARVAQLEKMAEEMKALLTKKEAEPWWKRTAGMFEGDKVFEEIMKEVRKARREDYRAVCREIEIAEKAERNGGGKSARGKKRRSNRSKSKGNA